MTTFTELYDDVQVIVKRPDLEADVILAIKEATLRAHRSDFFEKDIVQVPLVFSTPDYLVEINYRSLFSRYRSLKYIRDYDAVGQIAGKFFSLLEPDNVLDEYDRNKENVCYVAGDIIYIRSNTILTNVLFGYYANPVITQANYRSWIADEDPYLIVNMAASKVFSTTGYEEKANKYQRLAAGQLQQLMNNNAVSAGD